MWWLYFAEGQRTVTEHRECEENHRWQGVIDNPGYKGRVWRGWGAGDVIADMDRDLGPVPESDYAIVE